MRMLEVCLLFRNTREWEREEKGTTNFQKLKSNKVDNFLKMNSDIFWKIFFSSIHSSKNILPGKNSTTRSYLMRLKKLTSVIYYSYDIDLSTSRLSRKIERNRYVFYIDFFTTRDWTYIYAPVLMQKLCKNYSYPKIEIFHSFLKQCLHDLHFMKTRSSHQTLLIQPQLTSAERPCFHKMIKTVSKISPTN